MTRESKELRKVVVELPSHPDVRRATLTVTLTKKEPVAPGLTWDLRPAKGYTELSIVGDIRYRDGGETGGQCQDEIRRLWGDVPEIARLCDLWSEWHLNGLCAGTRVQTKALEGEELSRLDWYGDACKVLDSKGLLTDRGYKFGSAWLSKAIPEETLAEIGQLVRSIGPECAERDG